jgi:hypothetical protein
VPSLNRPDYELNALYILQWLGIATGFASGILIAQRQRVGRWLAIVLCAGSLVWFVVSHGEMLWEHHFLFWTGMARWLPQRFLRIVLDLLFYVATLAYMTRPRAIAWFRPERLR